VSSTGGTLVALGPDGTAVAGWPVSLLDSMAGYRAVHARADGTIEALAVVPTADGDQWSLVVLGADGSSRASTVLIEP
jgi:hypothetical protein